MDASALVIALTRSALAMGHGEAVHLPSLGPAVDWPAVFDLATVHRVAPLLCQALAEAPEGALPATVMAKFEAALLRSRAATMLCEHELISLLSTLSTAGIDVLVLKGATLANTIYPRPEFRPYHDLDILCRPSDFPRLARALSASGYSREPENEPWVRPAPLATLPVQSYRVPSGALAVEVHTDILQFGLVERQHEDFWRGAETIPLGPASLPVLAPTYQLLHLTAHAHRHGYVRLLWLADLDRFIRRWGPTLDWTRAIALAREEGIGMVLRHAVATTQVLLGTPPPPLPPPSREERALAPLYRRLWPRSHIRQLGRNEHRRLMRFRPDSRDPRDIVYGLVLLGRRREKLRVLLARVAMSLQPAATEKPGRRLVRNER